MSTQIFPINHYIKVLKLEKGRKIWYYNVDHSRYEEWYHMGVTQPIAGKTAFYDKQGKQLYFNGEMLNLCARTKNECKLLVYKSKCMFVENRMQRHNAIIKKAQKDIKEQQELKQKLKKRLKKHKRKFADIIEMFPEEFI